MNYFPPKWKNAFSSCSYFSQSNTTSHFHTNFFSKEYFPIYASFVIFSIVYNIQYVINGFLWKRIIFNVIFGPIFALIIYLASKFTKYSQMIFTVFFMFWTILLDKLIIRELKNDEMFFLGIYICIVYYNMIKGFNNILSNFAFFFMLMYFSGILLTSNLDDLTPFFGNFTICILQSYLTWKHSKNKSLETEKQNNEKKMWMHIFNKVFPGITLLLKKKDFNDQENNNTSPSLKDLLQIEFVNIRGQERYKIERNHEEIEQFFSNIKVITSQNHQLNIKKNETLINNDNLKKNTSSDIKFTLKDLILSFATENFNQISPEYKVLGVYKENSKKMKITLANFEWNTENLLLLHLDDENLEEEIKKLQEDDLKKNELLASVTHDLRSPLNGMLAFINNAKNNENNNEREKMLHYAEINGKLLMSLINDILDYSSFLNDKLNLIKESFHLDNLVTEVIDLMAVQASAKNIELKVDKEFPENLHLFSDSRRIKQILINLIGNSIKFTMKGFIKLKVSQTKYKNILKFTVKDSGVGIKKETLDKLCTPYATFDTEKGLNKYGIGLGLNICKKLISLLGPNEIMNITSEYMVGTKISFYIFLDINNKKNIYEIRSSINKKKFETKKLRSGEIEFPLGPMLSNFSPELHSKKRFKKDIENKRNSSMSQSATLKEKPNFSEMLLRLNCRSLSHKIDLKKEKSKNRDFLNESQRLEFSSFGSMSNKSDFEEKPKDNSSGQIYIFENKFLIASKSINEGVTSNLLNEIPKQKISIYSPLKTFRVLIADDNPFNIFVITTYLKKIKNIKLYYDNACNGVEAVCKFKEKNENNSNKYFNLIFMDCLMPIKNGFEASLEIKSLIESKQYQRTVIIGVTGLSGQEEEKKCLENGMDRYIGKPISEKQCLDLIYYYFDKEFFNFD